MNEESVPELERVFVARCEAVLPARIVSPPDIRNKALQIGWHYDSDEVGEKVTSDLLIIFYTHDEETAEQEERDLDGQLLIRSVWQPRGHGPDYILDTFAVPILQQKGVDALNELFSQLGIGTIQIEPGFFEYEREGDVSGE